MLRGSEAYKRKGLLKKSPIDLVGRYLEEIGQYKLLTAEDEVRLFSDIEVGLQAYSSVTSWEELGQTEDQALCNLAIAYQTLYKSNTKLVVSIAQQYASRSNMSFIDLVQEGNAGLSKAIRRFDIGKGFKLSTYATTWIQQYITRSLANDSRTIRLPVHAHEKWLKLNKAAMNLTQKLDRTPTASEIAEVMGMSARQVENLQRNGALNLKSLNDPFGDQEEREFGDSISDPFSMDDAIDNLSNKQYLLEILVDAPLDPRELTVLCLRSGVYLEVFDDVMVMARGGERSYKELLDNMPTTDGLTLETISELFGVTRERIRQIEGQAFDKVRLSLAVNKEEEPAA